MKRKRLLFLVITIMVLSFTAYGQEGNVKDITRYIETLRSEGNDSQKEAVEVLKSYGKSAVPLLFEALRTVPVFFDEKAMETTIIKVEDGFMAMHIAEVLCLMDSEVILHKLIKFSLEEGKKMSKKFGLSEDMSDEMMEKMMTEDPQLLEAIMMETLRITTVYDATVQGMINVGGGMIPRLISALKNEDWELRSIALMILEQFYTANNDYKSVVVRACIDMLDDNVPEVRMVAKSGLIFIIGEDFEGNKEKWEEWWSENKEQIE